MNFRLFLKKYSLSEEFNKIKRIQILETFSEYIEENGFNHLHLSLYPFTNDIPLKYFHKNKIKVFYTFLKEYELQAIKYITINSSNLSHAVTSLFRNAPSWVLEKNFFIDTPEQLEVIDSIYHPEYIRYSEHIYNSFIGVPLDILSKKHHENLTTSNNKSLKGTPLEIFTDGFDSIVRNAISHGNITYSNSLITYTSREGTVKLIGSDLLEIFDNLVYNCHSMLIAYLLFIIDHFDTFDKRTLPVCFKMLFIKGQCEQIDFTILPSIETTIPKGKQLNFRCKTEINNKLWHYFQTLRIAVVSYLYYDGKIYSRYSVSINFGREIPALFIINFDKLDKALTDNWNFTRMNEVFEPLLNNWYDIKLNKWQPYFIRQFIKLTLKVGKLNRINELKSKGHPLLQHRFLIREKEVVDSGKYRTIKIKAVLKEHNLTDNTIIQIVNYIIEKNKKDLTPRKDFISRKIIIRKPGRIMLYLFKNNYRIRSLNSLSVVDNYILQADYTVKGFPYRSGIEPDLEVNNIRIRFGELN